MAKAIILSAPGTAEVMNLKDFAEPQINENELLIRHSAIEVNQIDILQRKGLIKLPENKKIPGVAAVGFVEKKGAKVAGFDIGDRVGYALALNGAYATHAAVNKDLLFKIPDKITDIVAAACLVKGMAAHTMALRTYIVKSGVRVLIHSVAGGVGHIILQYAKLAGCEVIGTVGHDSKIDFAKKLGCDYVINYNKENLLEKVSQYSNRKGVNAVFDGLGAKFIEENLTMLMPFGILLNYGSITGSIPKIDPAKIASKSLFVTMPSIYHYKTYRMEMILTADEIFRRVIDGDFKINIDSTYKLEEAHLAHKRLESGENIGSIVMTID